MADGVASAIAVDASTHVAPRRGRLRLAPVEGSTSAETLEIEVELSRADARLTVGDLRRAAVAHDEADRTEEAHRLWAAVALAAASVDAPQLEELARRRVIECLGSQRPSPSTEDPIADSFRRSKVRYDYLAIAADRAAGMTATDTATKHGCSPRTVARAVDFAGLRDETLSRHPGLAAQLSEDADPVSLATSHGVDVNVMRWMLAVHLDRRRPRARGEAAAPTKAN